MKRKGIYVIYMEQNLTVSFREEILVLSFKVSEFQFDLYMRVDSNTKGHRQWFYFSMQNEAKCQVKLHIYRFKKKYSLFQRGMRPYIKSRKSGGDWKPGGQQIYYHYQNKPNPYAIKKQNHSFVLTFTYTFQHQNDEVFIAAGVPYTYSFLQKQLLGFKTIIQKHSKLDMDLSVLTKSMCGLEVQLLTIKHKLSNIINKDKDKKKKIIIINTRTHSGETSSSWVLDGMLMEICQSSSLEQWLLAQNIILKIIPMLNPDGVFIGNYRTGIIGEDFNRKFNTGKRQYYPEISALRKLVGLSKKEGQVQLFLDLHGHSILKNVFIYGPFFKEFSNSKLRNLPDCLSQNSKYFRLGSCKFKAENENMQTARVFFQLKEQILSFTCQNSLGLYYHQYKTHQMMAKDWQQFGKSLIISIKDLFYKEIIVHREFQQKKVNQNTSSKHQMIVGSQRRADSTKNKINYKLKSSSSKVQKFGSKIFTAQSIKQEFNQKNLQKMKIIGDNLKRQNTIYQNQILQDPAQNNNTHENISANMKRPINSRRKSEIIRKGQSNLVQKILKKYKKPQKESLYNSTQHHVQVEQNIFGRSSTFDQSSMLRQEINNANKVSQQDDYQLQVIHENFSDQYCSINDQDSEGQNLPDQEKKYIFQYIKLNKIRGNNGSQEDEEKKIDTMEISKQVSTKDNKISKFRQIRFKSIEEVLEKEYDQIKDVPKSIKKIKLEPHKFKDNTSKSLVYKYNEILANNTQYQDPGIVTISQQKKLYQRSKSKRKDPFILIQKKGKAPQFFDKGGQND